jgi:catechol 2,3-dioxygenase-like lactoylglutathione lyase family enzyme
MAYRFLLETPENLAPEASLAVNGTPDAQVILVRDSHGLGFEDEFVNLTVAAHSLRVIDGIYDWFDSLGASRPDLRLVLHSGERVNLEAVDRGAMVATIRRDQPWVERTLPKVGEHEEDLFATPATEPGEPLGVRIDGAGSNAPDRSFGLATEPADLPRRVRLGAINHIAVKVNDLAKAETFYQTFLDMQLIGRFRTGAIGGLEMVEESYDWEAAIHAGRPADVSFVTNGAVTLALINAGRGARIDRGQIDHISVSVDGAAFDTLRGEALIRPMVLTSNTERAFRFLDPYGIGWEITREAPVGAAVVR